MGGACRKDFCIVDEQATWRRSCSLHTVTEYSFSLVQNHLTASPFPFPPFPSLRFPFPRLLMLNLPPPPQNLGSVWTSAIQHLCSDRFKSGLNLFKNFYFLLLKFYFLCKKICLKTSKFASMEQLNNTKKTRGLNSESKVFANLKKPIFYIVIVFFLSEKKKKLFG